jgi:hypothetical protein
MPNDTSKPEWKLSGQIVTVPDLPLNLLVSTLRDRILQHTGSSISASRIRLSYQGKMLNSSSIAATNREHKDLFGRSRRLRDTGGWGGNRASRGSCWIWWGQDELGHSRRLRDTRGRGGNRGTSSTTG